MCATAKPLVRMRLSATLEKECRGETMTPPPSSHGHVPMAYLWRQRCGDSEVLVMIHAAPPRVHPPSWWNAEMLKCWKNDNFWPLLPLRVLRPWQWAESHGNRGIVWCNSWKKRLWQWCVVWVVREEIRGFGPFGRKVVKIEIECQFVQIRKVRWFAESKLIWMR